ncbi:zinc finger protein 35-like [Achroia grisella]|uniref:zinc finger protein 35-like n=1 Tax=Achroia grisella TaxID=688607 RepID=UPI0027D2405D|nr:zinc finger protein 35-like [Achroia grisella]
MDTWSNLCRCCLSPDSEVSLFDEKNVTEKFHEVTTVVVKHDDGLPQKLCFECYTKMNSAYQFRRQCIKMDSELKLQLNAILSENYTDDTNSVKNQSLDGDDIADDPIKQLESIIKKEPVDSDDDYYYVLVIDDPKEKDDEKELESSTLLANIKLENAEEMQSPLEEIQQILNEPIKEIPEPSNTFKGLDSIDSFLVSNTKVPINVPATILENEEESQENYESYTHPMEMEETQDSASQDEIPGMVTEDNEIDEENISNNIVGSLPTSKSIIKILTSSSSDGTIILKNNESIQYLTNNELIANNDRLDEEQVIYCEDDNTQYQIIKCDGTELVIEYSDGGQVATVLQQDDGTFVCDCGEQFDDLAEYEKHQYKHNPAGEHLCNLCGKGFESAEILTGHILLHSFTGLLITCPFCNQVVRRNTLTQHIKYGHNNIKPRCDLCFKTFANPNNLKRHMMIHKGVREFECDICYKRFHQKITMQTHRMTHLNPFSCNQCDLIFNNKTELTDHKDSEDCTKSKVTKVKQELMKTVKQEITTNLGKLLGYACSLCKKMFSVESALEQHIESSHIVDPTELLCSECGEVLPSKKDMQTHILSHKNMKLKSVKRFECTMCGKGCSSQAMLIMHERVHTNERPFPCQLCSLRFKTKTHLRTHQLTHTREKKFGCSVCMKFFALKGNLVVHLRTHTGERPYVCTLCGEAFIDSKYLKKHKLKKHAIDNVPWNKY